VLALPALAALGGGYQTVGERVDATTSSTPGRLVDVGGRRLHLSCTGAGSPTVVLEPGAGETSAVLGRITPAVARARRVCGYDRAGRGASERADTRQHARQVATDLHTLLRRGHVRGPTCWPATPSAASTRSPSPRAIPPGQPRRVPEPAPARRRDAGDMPMVAVTAGVGHDAAWRRAQADLVSLSTDGAHRVVPGATHAPWASTRTTPLPPPGRSSTSSPRSAPRNRWPAHGRVDDHGRVSPPSSASPDVVPDPHLVTRLLREQTPHLADLPVRRSHASGSSNWVFRVGDALAVRLPRSDDYAGDLVKEVRWLPRLASQLPAAVPEVVAVGEPSTTFPRPWAVVSWVPGDLPLGLDSERQVLLAESLGAFLRGLHAVDATDVPVGSAHWGYRCGEPVTDEIDGWAEHAAAELADRYDPTRVREAWRRLREVPAATEAARWVHTDLSEENLLVHDDGRLAGVIDFGAMGVGDRSVDLLYAWSIFDAPAREVLRAASGVDDATWTRARAWAFVGPGLLTVAHYRHTMPDRTKRLTAMVEAVAAEVGVPLR